MYKTLFYNLVKKFNTKLFSRVSAGRIFSSLLKNIFFRLWVHIFGTSAMVKLSCIAKLSCAGTFVGIIVFYVIYWEPYCFFKTPLYSEGTRSLADSKIYTYGLFRSPSSKTNLITILTPKISSKLIPTLQLLDLNLADNFTTNVLIMYSDEPCKDDLLRLSESTQRQVSFLDVTSSFNLFPVGFDACRTRTSFLQKRKVELSADDTILVQDFI